MSCAFKQVAVASKCLAIVMEKCTDSTDPIKRKSGGGRPSANATNAALRDNGYRIFQEFQEENRVSYWNPALVESVNSVDYVGFVRPGTLFVSGAEYHLECLRNAWARRVLKSPSGFTIKSLGDVGGIEMQEVPQTQFIPLPEVLCLIISGLNRLGQPATMSTIVENLQEEYSGMTIPKQEILFATLGTLMAEGKLFCMGDHYFVPTPSMMQQYHQAMFLRRPPPAMFWNAEDALSTNYRQFLLRQQETCSKECQTGASIVDGVPPYKPPPPATVGKKDQAASAKLQRATENCNANCIKSFNNNNNGHQKLSKEQKGENVKNEKLGFLARLFGRPQPKTRNDDKSQQQQQQQQLTKIQQNNNNNNAQNSPPSQSSGGSQGSTNVQNVAAVPLATFSAQFPPPEWLYDPRFFKASSKHAAQQQMLFAKIRKSSKDSHNNNNNNNNKQDLNNVWIDLDPRFKRDSTDGRFVSQRHVTCPENLAKNAGGRWSPKHERNARNNRQRPRLSKYMSSSSECLNYLAAPLADDEQQHYCYKETKKSHKIKLHKMATQNCDAATTNLEKFAVTEPCDQNVLEFGRTETKKKSSAPQTPVAVTVNVQRNSIPDFGGRTSTPTKISAPAENPPRDCQENRDSAISSTSPVVTEMSSSEAKYSSWSGSDGQQEIPAIPAQQLDHTYVNEKPNTKNDETNVVVNHTYENIEKDETQFENLSADELAKEDLLIPSKINNNNNNNNHNNFENEDEYPTIKRNDERSQDSNNKNCPIKIRPNYISAV